jgi:hypothetical protein
MIEGRRRAMARGNGELRTMRDMPAMNSANGIAI